MKNLMILALTLASSVSFASISNSSYEKNHLVAIEKAIKSNCGRFLELEEVSSTVKKIKVDNGITDYNYITVLEGLYRVDQGVFDKYQITIQSDYTDAYNHSTKDWGIYSVNSISCTMK